MNKEAKVTIGNTTETIGDAHEGYMQGMKDILNRANSNSPHFPKDESSDEHAGKVASGVGEIINYTTLLIQRIEDLELELKIAAKETENLQHAFHVFSNFIDENHNNVITAEEVLDMELGNLSELDN